MIHGRKKPTSAAHVESTLSLEFYIHYTSSRETRILSMFRPKVVLRSLFLQPCNPTIYVQGTALSIASTEAPGCLNERFLILDNTSGARIWTRDPHTISVHVRGMFSLLHWAVPRSEHLTANVIPAIQLPETVCRGDAAELT